MARKEAEIDRKGSKPHILQVRVKDGDKEVKWSINEKTEFRIWFPEDWNPLDAGDNVSKKGQLTRRFRDDLPRGHNSHYPYSIFLINSKEMVESDSPPEMVIE